MMKGNRDRRNRETLLLAAAAALFALSPLITLAQSVSPNAGVEAAVREAFADAPVMVAVAKCESGFRQFSSEGVVLRGGSGKGYIGIFQIGERLHRAPAAKLGMDIDTVEGNIAYARRLYDAQGSVPWRECVPKDAAQSAAPTAVAPANGALTANLVLGMKGPQVLMLQRMLNEKGFTIASSGPGSPGNETSMFGALTREALRRFQCAKGIACEGSEATTGYGRLGPKTRAALSP